MLKKYNIPLWLKIPLVPVFLLLTPIFAIGFIFYVLGIDIWKILYESPDESNNINFYGDEPTRR